MKSKRRHFTTKNNHNGRRKTFQISLPPLINYPENIKDCQIKTEYEIPNDVWLKNKHQYFKETDRFNDEFYRYDGDCKILVNGCSWGFYKRNFLVFCMEESDIKRDFEILKFPNVEKVIQEIKDNGWEPNLLSFLICISIERHIKLIKDLMR